jgi:hypothetical protein
MDWSATGPQPSSLATVLGLGGAQPEAVGAGLDDVSVLKVTRSTMAAASRGSAIRCALAAQVKPDQMSTPSRDLAAPARLVLRASERSGSRLS